MTGRETLRLICRTFVTQTGGAHPLARRAASSASRRNLERVLFDCHARRGAACTARVQSATRNHPTLAYIFERTLSEIATISPCICHRNNN
jgi:hypothetical protein